MATTTSGAQHGLSLYLRVCCVNSNLGQTVHMRENNSNKHILCPSVRPLSCPGKLYCMYNYNIKFKLIKTVRAGLLPGIT